MGTGYEVRVRFRAEDASDAVQRAVDEALAARRVEGEPGVVLPDQRDPEVLVARLVVDADDASLAELEAERLVERAVHEAGLTRGRCEVLEMDVRTGS